MSSQISIIIPVLNEAPFIRKLLEHLLDNASAENITEILVVDGGSTDETPQIVQAFSEGPITYLHSEKGRAKQMNFGAKQANGDILYFLHADSFPPKYFDTFILAEVQKGHEAGCFRMQFDSQHWWLKLASWLTQFSWRACRGGDQSQFITKSLFRDIGGFDERYIIYEDNMLINALYARKQFVVINKKLQTSARCYEEHGVWKIQYIYWSVYVKKWFGASAEELHQFYLSRVAR
ncbi:TIGR04283 family arsenosugar biosynthesis glycosyltransferase [Tamlana sp. 2_MG-2023]|uniref:TIGR04283 family arsenosugar biosynthesis glycosyltransferase n=1 Tax=unclassified Tamlana TaxID=2614803 RepID=UPI0026E31BAB|nr:MULTISPECIES: TIGR04283 family arsenosugar biosynthesis glycosyltransferase [unclassified Tamlana]MDO6760925.1 TIGR04283 family arsenosugar biosynthesis glycosyltransferase [Tamlana sp. 2_MG-2023]MDO6791181.1 TIGR04283 family arsenosugar biosynthesis glycosyltransferase [Tamlana sp. 1_MG-2023]